jgi:hypothetical protein
MTLNEIIDAMEKVEIQIEIATGSCPNEHRDLSDLYSEWDRLHDLLTSDKKAA